MRPMLKVEVAMTGWALDLDDGDIVNLNGRSAMRTIQLVHDAAVDVSPDEGW